MPENIYVDLKKFIDDKNPRENECRYYPQFAKELLIDDFPIEFKNIETERRLNTGDSDYIISAKVYHSGDTCIRAYIWELKAPQCPIFVKDTESRLKPSPELADAENKLLHFYFENKGNPLFHQQYEITNPEDICLGGIIIGCQKTKVGGELEEEKRERLFKTAKSTKNLLYGKQIKLKSWDEVLAQISRQEISGRHQTTEQEVTLKAIPTI